MTNKTERYFVCSESELERLRKRSFTAGCRLTDEPMRDMREAEAACRAREVPSWATHWVAFPTAPHGEGYRISVQRHEEIKK